MIDKNLQIAVVGGDLRHAHLANTLAQSGYTVAALCLEKEVYLKETVDAPADMREVLFHSGVIVLPLPVTLDGRTVNAPFSTCGLPLDDIFRYAKKGTLILGGMFEPELRAKGEALGFTLVDYLEREELAVMNAIPTAEGALAIAMQELPITIFGSTCIITGFGRIAKVLAKLLCALEAKVIIAARRQEDLAWAKVYGCEGILLTRLIQHACRADILFNTIPVKLLDKKILACLGRDCLVVDLASKPGGVDFEAAKSLRIKTIWALSLPGKVAPFTAGEIIKDTVVNILTERGM